MAAWTLRDSEENDIRPQVMRAVHNLVSALSERGPAALAGGRQAELLRLARDARDALFMLDPRGKIGGFRYPTAAAQDRSRLSNLTDAAAAIAGRIAEGDAQPVDVGELKRLAAAIEAWPNDGGQGRARDGMTMAEIAKAVDLSRETIRKARNDAGIESLDTGQHHVKLDPHAIKCIATARERFMNDDERASWDRVLREVGQPVIGFPIPAKSKSKAKSKN